MSTIPEIQNIVVVKAPLILVKRFTKKNGEVSIKEYDQRKYNADWYQRNKAMLTTPVMCGCGGRYQSPNKTRHNNSKIHTTFLQIQELQHL